MLFNGNKSCGIAKDRLRQLILTDRMGCSPEILEMMKVLNAASMEMSSATEKMSEKTVAISESMKEITDSSSDILDSTGKTSGKLSQIKIFAGESADTSKNNHQLSEQVQALVSSYKVE